MDSSAQNGNVCYIRACLTVKNDMCHHCHEVIGPDDSVQGLMISCGSLRLGLSVTYFSASMSNIDIRKRERMILLQRVH